MSARAVTFRRSGGFTLLETLVAVVVLGFSAAVVGTSIGSALDRSAAPETWTTRLEDGREISVRSGANVVVTPDSAHVEEPALFLPDGRAVGRGVDPLGGRPGRIE